MADITVSHKLITSVVRASKIPYVVSSVKAMGILVLVYTFMRFNIALLNVIFEIAALSGVTRRSLRDKLSALYETVT